MQSLDKTQAGATSLGPFGIPWTPIGAAIAAWLASVLVVAAAGSVDVPGTVEAISESVVEDVGEDDEEDEEEEGEVSV